MFIPDSNVDQYVYEEEDGEVKSKEVRNICPIICEVRGCADNRTYSVQPFSPGETPKLRFSVVTYLCYLLMCFTTILN